MSDVKHWLSAPPDKCDLCSAGITTKFYDSKTIYGPWACLCPTCFANKGAGRLGLGAAQEYTLTRQKDESTKWEKTGG